MKIIKNRSSKYPTCEICGTPLPKKRDYLKECSTQCHVERMRKYYTKWQKSYRMRDIERNKRIQHKCYYKLRLEVIQHYGSKCVCCGESHIDFLAIDHIHGDGTKHRNVIGGTSQTLYRWIKKHNFPNSFQLLCHNCNHCKGKTDKPFCQVHHPELYSKSKEVVK